MFVFLSSTLTKVLTGLREKMKK